MSVDSQLDKDQIIKNTKQVYAVGSKKSEERPLFDIIKKITASALVMFATLQAYDVYDAYKFNQNIPKSTPITAPSSPIVVSLENENLSSVFNASSTNTPYSSELMPTFESFKTLMEDLGVDAKQARDVYLHLDEAQSVYILGRNNPIIADSLSDRQNISRGLLEDFWNADNPNDVDLSHDIIEERMQKDHARNWSGVSDEQIWQDIEFDWNKSLMIPALPIKSHSYLPEVDKNISLQEAMDNLQQAVSLSGLMSLKVPMQISNSPVMLDQFSKTLMKANQELQEVTGFEGGVLGLNYRAMLNLGAVYESAQVTVNEDGYIDVYAWWPTLGHEWFHALDFALTEINDGTNMYSTLSKQIKIDDDKWLVKNINEDKEKDPFNMRQRMIDLWMGINNPHLTLDDIEKIKQENIKRYSYVYGDDSTRKNIDNQPDGYNKSLFKTLIDNDERMLQTSTSLSYEVSGRDSANMRNALDHVSDKMQNKKESISGSPWIYWRRSAAELSYKQNEEYGDKISSYLLNPSEIIAFSFAEHLSEVQLDNFKEQNKNTSINIEEIMFDDDYSQEKGLVLLDGLESETLTYTPTSIETKANIKMWDGFFNSSNDWWVADQNSRMATLEVINAFSSSQPKEADITVILENRKTKMHLSPTKKDPQTHIKLSF